MSFEVTAVCVSGLNCPMLFHIALILQVTVFSDAEPISTMDSTLNLAANMLKMDK